MVPPASVSWRKRHPVLARLALYAVGAALGVGLFLALASRKEQDRGDRLAFLWAQLEGLPIVLQGDPTGPQVLKVLDQDYVDPALPADLRARAERFRGVLARNARVKAGVDAAYARARALDPSQAAVTDLEWAQCLVGVDAGAEALTKLPPPASLSGSHRIWALLVEAQARAQTGAAADARDRLERALAALPSPLPDEPAAWFGLASWTPAGAALEATRWLVLDAPPASPRSLGAWQRLVELAPRDPEALLVASEGLLAGGDEGGARGGVERLERADAAFARRALADRPGLAALRKR